MCRNFLIAAAFCLLVTGPNLMAQSGAKNVRPTDEDLKELGNPNSKNIGIVDAEDGQRLEGEDGRTDSDAKRTAGKNGSQVITDLQGRRTVEISEFKKSGITVVITMRYGPNELERLMGKHPDLEEYIKLFPKKVDNSEIEMTLSLKSVHRAKTAAELQAKHPKAFNLYRRYYVPRKNSLTKTN